jgi:Ca-activated chloride channel family protein
MTSYFAPRHAKSAVPLGLDMQSLFLSGRVLPFGAKLSVTHVFRSCEKSPVEVIYCFPLPRDAFLVSFQISGDHFSISSRLEPTADAQKRYEQALEDGSLAALTQQNLDGLVNLTVGNLRPGETVSVRLDLIAGVSLSDSGFRLRFPFTVAPCYHSQMRVSLDGPGIGTIELPEHVAHGVFLPPLHADASDLHRIGFELQVEPADGIGEIASPSHAVCLVLNNPAAIGVKLSRDRDVPNRDLVLDVKHDLGTGRAWSDRACNDRKHFAAVVPSTVFGQQTTTMRRVVFLLDRSGSMEGAPIQQARYAIENCLARLGPEDQFGIVVFDNQVGRFHQAMYAATRDNLDEACAFLNTIDARGGTELASGFEAAAQLLAGSSGEIFVVTDGQVFETVEILRRARKCGVRLFCLGIGSASQDRFLELLARQTAGVCRFVTPSERVDAAASELFAALGGTVVAEVRIENANVEPPSTGTVFSDTPFFALGDVDHEADTIVVEWPQGASRVPFEAPGKELDGLIEKVQGAKLIADFEARYDHSDTAARQQLLELSERYGLASSEMSLVAVVERADDQTGEIPKTNIVPVGMPQDTRFASYFGAAAAYHLPAAKPSSGPLYSRRSGAKSRVDFEASLGPALSIPIWVPGMQADTAIDLSGALRETMEIIDGCASTPSNKDLSTNLASMLDKLVFHESQLERETQREALTALIDFLSSDMIDFLDTGYLDVHNWQAVRRQLEQAWPQLASAGTVSGPLTHE